MLRVRDWVKKRCFVELKDGTTVPVIHKSVILDDGTTIRWNRKAGCWKIVDPERFDTAVTTSLQSRAMTVAIEKGRYRSIAKEWFVFENFAVEMLKIVDQDTLLDIVLYLK